MNLEAEISKHSAKVSSDSYSMSVGELSSMYTDGELNIHPEFQRFFRWKSEQKSRLVESLLLGIPIPPIFVSENDKSRWDVIDGLQRLSTIFELMGILKDEMNQEQEPLVLTGTKYLPSLAGKVWKEDFEGRDRLPESARIKIKRARLDVNIVKNTSDEIAKYEIFQRLNSGGSAGTDQEVRNCILVMNNRSFFEWLKKDLGANKFFSETILLTERAMDEAFDLELITRFIVFSVVDESRLLSIEELGGFLTDEIVDISNSQDFDKVRIGLVFDEVFQYLSEHLGQDSFRKFDSRKSCYYGATLVSLFEVIGVGLARRRLQEKTFPNPTKFIEKHRLLGSNDQLKQFTKSGVRSSTRIPRTITFGREWLDECS